MKSYFKIITIALGTSLTISTYAAATPYLLGYSASFNPNPSPSPNNSATATLYQVTSDNKLNPIQAFQPITIGVENPGYVYVDPNTQLVYFANGVNIYSYNPQSGQPTQIATLLLANGQGQSPNIEAAASFTDATGDTDIIFGGNFMGIAPTKGQQFATNSLAVYDTKTQTWSSIGSIALDGTPKYPMSVHTIAVLGNTIYVGGYFSDIIVNGQDMPVQNLAQYNIDGGQWSATPPLSNSNEVWTLAVFNETLYAGTYTAPRNSVLAFYDADTQQWVNTPITSPGSQLNVYNLAGDPSHLYIVTNNTNPVTNTCISTNGECIVTLSQYDGKSLNPTTLGNFVWDGQHGGITAISMDDNGTIYAGGLFAGACTDSSCTVLVPNTSGFAAYAGGNWLSMDSQIVPTGTLPYNPFPNVQFAGLASGNAP